jgi:hypothetical protein
VNNGKLISTDDLLSQFSGESPLSHTIRPVRSDKTKANDEIEFLKPLIRSTLE